MGYLPPLSESQREHAGTFADKLRSLQQNIEVFLNTVKRVGITPEMSEGEKSKLGVFNNLIFFQLLTGIALPVLILYNAHNFPADGWFKVCLPALLSVGVLVMNAYHKTKEALIAYFFLYPVFICIIYMHGINLGVELSFVLYGILSVFFLQDLGYMIFSICFSMVSYFILAVVWKTYPYQLSQTNFTAYLINQGLSVLYIFYGLYLIKTETTSYQSHILLKNDVLHKTNKEIEIQAERLQKQTQELDRLNSLKNKTFSVISHDLKTPLYALRNLFDNMQSQKMSSEQIVEFIPDVQNDLNYTVSLMENLLQWAKSQMQADIVKAQAINAKEVIDDVLRLMNLQADAKKIKIENRATDRVYLWADKDMINLVLRNLISNAIKFTPPGGSVSIGASERSSFTEVYVKDSGKGISNKEMQEIQSQNFYSTNGTAQEQGTGLGLVLCKEFLEKNGGKLHIESMPGKGSIFSFTLPNA
jgi:two-component system, sensor histidine kinase and response regulator